MDGQHFSDDTPNGKVSPPLARQPFTPPPRESSLEHLAASEAASAKMTPAQRLRNDPSNSIQNLSFCASPSDDYARGAREANNPQRRKISPRPSSSSPDEAPSPSLGAVLRKAAIDHQLGISINLFLLAALSWLLFPKLRPRLEVLATLRYRTERTTGDGEALFGQGPQDFGIVVMFMVLMTGVRAAMMDYVLMPFATACGIGKRKTKVRFVEQTYLILYYLIYWSWGLHLFIRDTPASLPLSAEGQSLPLTANNLLISLWTHYPRLFLSASMKLYYLSQLAFWTQQIIVIHLEDRRKDHYQMLTHHFVTVALLAGSYGYRQMRVGNAVLVCMDIIDLIFPTAKIFKYLGWQTACDMTFALFVVAWLVCRHVGYLAICWSIHAHVAKVVMPYGLYTISAKSTTPTTAPPSSTNDIVSGSRISPDGGSTVWENLFQPILNRAATTVSFNANVKYTFLGLLLGLQIITFLWFLMICRVVARVLRGDGADDSRSDDEEEGEDEDAEDQNEKDIDVKNPGPVQPSAPFVAPPASSQQQQQQTYIEVEASSADFSGLRGSSSSTLAGSSGIGSSGAGKSRKSKGLSTGLNLGDHKEILNRIGCLSEEQLAREREKRSPDPSSRPGSSRR